MKICENCLWWSELIAEGQFLPSGGASITALCENMNGPLKGKMTKSGETCHKWERS